jgi:predicted cupin superfamily sugar epimerase
MYTSAVIVATPPGGAGTRVVVTLIHYRLLPGKRSDWRTVASDEI